MTGENRPKKGEQINRDYKHRWLKNIQIEGRPGLTKGLQGMSDVFGAGDYQLHYAGSNGKYYVKFGNEGNLSTARDSNDPTKPFILDWNNQ